MYKPFYWTKTPQNQRTHKTLWNASLRHLTTKISVPIHGNGYKNLSTFIVNFFETKHILYFKLHYDVCLSFKGLLSVHNIDNVSTLSTMKTLTTKESPSYLVLVLCVVKSCEPNGLGDMKITVKVTTFPKGNILSYGEWNTLKCNYNVLHYNIPQELLRPMFIKNSYKTLNLEMTSKLELCYY